jgi:LmbE family N-acetylglucosaminyl deacetylase
MNNTETILFIGAHHEEIEAECPNIPAKLAALGHRVVILNPVGGWNWSFVRKLGDGGRERIIQEAVAAAGELGCEKMIWDFPIAEVAENRLEIMHKMADFVMDLNPSIVFIHWAEDSHADHRAIAQISHHVLRTAPSLVEDYQRPFNIEEVYAYQVGINQTGSFWPDMLVMADAESMNKAEKAIKCFYGTSKDMAKSWWKNVQTKTGYWSHIAHDRPAEALKFIGPALPLKGFKLAKLLGEDLIPASSENWLFKKEYQ